eukprot:TRINITY_DN17691_c0_g1_i1.p1 TRINITY_DN17691_c0_g1~~TRINITY_DN17691_c0_g1_i1.p1  ORF type:complete len:234 (+),score=74.28 TRINITY_DN17691_c0_g1_i1:45-746(+)
MVKNDKLTVRKSKFKREDKLVVTFDEESRKDFITGFHKRKQERRRIAQEQAMKRAKKEILEQRKQKREMIQNRLEQIRAMREGMFPSDVADGSENEDENKDETAEGDLPTASQSKTHTNSDVRSNLKRKANKDDETQLSTETPSQTKGDSGDHSQKQKVITKKEGTKVTTTVITTFDPFQEVMEAKQNAARMASIQAAKDKLAAMQQVKVVKTVPQKVRQRKKKFKYNPYDDE